MNTGNQLQSLTAINLANAYDNIQSGDLMFCSGNGLVSNLIKRATHSDISHIALLIQLPTTGQWLVLESVESIGVRCVTLEDGYLTNYRDSGKGYDGRIYIARHNQVTKHRDKFSQMVNKAFSLTGDLYSKEDIFHIATRIALSKVGIDNQQSMIHEKNHYICSEYVYTCYKAMGIDLPFDPLGFIAPADIANLDAVNPICQLRINEPTTIPVPRATEAALV